jgi:hypothetical protein
MSNQTEVSETITIVHIPSMKRSHQGDYDRFLFRQQWKAYVKASPRSSLKTSANNWLRAWPLAMTQFTLVNSDKLNIKFVYGNSVLRMTGDEYVIQI